MMRQKLILTAFFLCNIFSAIAQDTIPKEILLWPNGAPGSEGKTGSENVRITDQGDHVITNIHKPSVTPYFPAADKNTGTALIVIPGGGHSELWITHEGYNPAKWFADHGITTFVLKYRLAKEKKSTYTIDKDELADLQQAIKLVWSRAKEWHIDTTKIGVMGFSAGGELAALSAMHISPVNPNAPGIIEQQSDRPNFQVLMYPGNISRFEVSKNSPPVFIAAGNNDRPDISEGVAQLYLKYKQANIPAELHIYAKVGHGFGIRPSNAGAVTLWPQEVMLWLTDIGILK
ncbi:MAG: Endo,4-beta-xylanase precursor [Mucilaginibacter sp.]|nr:Endo,4-beta-xylanase precursor [Mucilaginibacter sp.]